MKGVPLLFYWGRDLTNFTETSVDGFSIAGNVFVRVHFYQTMDARDWNVRDAARPNETALMTSQTPPLRQLLSPEER